ncbi:MAG: DUF808 domain-containing protein [Deltaproteobacteria bacterium]|nr:DUF808 domain-containing protein [Deltaproteobacteria bacterium]
MSGLLALLDDVAALAKVAATSLDDVVEQAAHASVDAAGMVIDDAAVTPKYVDGFSPERELPIVWKIAKGSLFNKLVLLLPVALLLSYFAPWALQPLLMLGGSYLCYEGAEKIWHVLHPHPEQHGGDALGPGDPAHLEEAKVKGAVKTDFVLSAEIMTVSLATLETDSLLFEAIALAIAGVLITFVVYGSVALLVKADDVGLHLARKSRIAAIRQLGRAVVRGMPGFMRLLANVGTAAMLWVGASIILHALAQLGVDAPEHAIAVAADTASAGLPSPLLGMLHWTVAAALDGVLGLLYGLCLLPLVGGLLLPLVARLRSKPAAG